MGESSELQAQCPGSPPAEAEAALAQMHGGQGGS